MQDTIARAQQRAAQSANLTELDAFRQEMRYAGLGSRPDIFRQGYDIDDDAIVAARKAILPPIPEGAENEHELLSRREDERHQFSYGNPYLVSMPDAQGNAEYEVPVIHRWQNGAYSAKGTHGKKTETEETVRVKVNILKGQGGRETQGDTGRQTAAERRSDFKPAAKPTKRRRK